MQTFTFQAVACRYNFCKAGWADLSVLITPRAIIIPHAQGRKRLRTQTFTFQAVACRYNFCEAGRTDLSVRIALCAIIIPYLLCWVKMYVYVSRETLSENHKNEQ